MAASTDCGLLADSPSRLPLSSFSVRARDFFLSYRKVDLRPTEVIHSIHVPWAVEHEYVHPYKQVSQTRVPRGG